MKKTKVICTIGPASDNEETVTKLVEAGMNASRHNFSHGDHEGNGRSIDIVKKVRKKLGKQIAIILDTKGPEIRTGNFKGTSVELKQGNKFTVSTGEEVLGDETKCSVSYDKLHEDVKKGDTILIDDGLVGLEVESVEGRKIHCVVKNTGFVGNHKGVNIPGVSIQLPALTPKDEGDLKFGIKKGIDLITASFIRKGSDVESIRKVLRENGGEEISIFSKIESQEGIDNIDEIIKASDGIMVARGDMGVEIPSKEVPLVQKSIIEKCNKAGKPVITATQMLDSMIRNPRPTRAEASDVANAIFDGTDAIMLSGETAGGKYPVEAATTMTEIAETVEESDRYKKMLEHKRTEKANNIANAISLSTCNAALSLNASAIITATQSGYTARMVSAYRPECPIIAATPHKKVARRLALNWGVYPIIVPKVESTDELIKISIEGALKTKYVNKKDIVIFAAGIPTGTSGNTNMLKIQEV
ncbi:MAG: pyruvate kinase [Clostridium sp.]|nr:pyruvate kinase [Clostridium sp.]